MPFDLEFWKQWVGQIVDSEFPLERCTGGGSRGAVFETQFQGRPAAIKIVPGTPQSIDALLTLWEKAAGLSNPALVRIFARGKTALGDMRGAYIVMERADENLADVLAQRPLTSAETREMLLPLLGALRYLHAKGFAHGGLKPGNIMAFGEQLKISSDGLVPGGDSAADCGAIGVLLEEVLGANRNAPLPEPFAEIAKNCLMPDPTARWNPTRIEACLRGDPAPAAQARSRAGWWALAAAAAVILGLVAFWPSQAHNSNRYAGVPAPKGNAAPDSAASDSKPPAEAKPAGAPQKPQPSTAKQETSARPPAGRAKASARSNAQANLDGITEVLPEIPQAARNTITGMVRVNIRVRVDRAGRVNQASLEPPPASKYFSERVLAAARAWKFPAGNAPRDWVLRFRLMRQQTRVSAAKIAN